MAHCRSFWAYVADCGPQVEPCRSSRRSPCLTSRAKRPSILVGACGTKRRIGKPSSSVSVRENGISKRKREGWRELPVRRLKIKGWCSGNALVWLDLSVHVHCPSTCAPWASRKLWRLALVAPSTIANYGCIDISSITASFDSVPRTRSIKSFDQRDWKLSVRYSHG